jgi:hypothetical protein
MKNAIVAKITGWIVEVRTKKSELVRPFMWKSQPIAISRSERIA